MTMRRLIESMGSTDMRAILERLEVKTKTGVTLRVLSGGQEPEPDVAAASQGAEPPSSSKPSEYGYVGTSVGVPVGETVERDGLRFHRYASSLRVTDITNAGKRGKSCPEFALFNLDYGVKDAKQIAAVEDALKAIAKAKTYAQAVALARGVAAKDSQRGMAFASVEERQLRGVDVEPASDSTGRTIKIETPTFTLAAGATDFSVSEKVRPGHGGDDTRMIIPPVGGAKKTAITVFRSWVKQNLNDIKRMTFRELSKAMADAGLNYHSFSTMD
jgi:hypothetical protein